MTKQAPRPIYQFPSRIRSLLAQVYPLTLVFPGCTRNKVKMHPKKSWELYTGQWRLYHVFVTLGKGPYCDTQHHGSRNRFWNRLYLNTNILTKLSGSLPRELLIAKHRQAPLKSKAWHHTSLQLGLWKNQFRFYKIFQLNRRRIFRTKELKRYKWGYISQRFLICVVIHTWSIKRLGKRVEHCVHSN